MNERSVKRGGMRLAVFALVLFACVALPAQAHAVVNLGTVGVAVPESISLDSGQTGQVAVTCDPAYSDQYPNCLNDYCPSGCDFGKTGDGVACEDKTGQCTCYGYKSARYYPSCTVSSSNPSVVRASWSDGVLSVSGYKAGTATLTVVPSLRLFSSLPATIQVEVTEPPAPKPAQSASEAQEEAPAKQSQQAEQSAAAASERTSSPGKGGVSASSAKSGKGSGASSVAVTSSSKGTSSTTSGSSGSTSTGRSGAGTIVSVIEQADAGDQSAGDSAETPEGTVSSDAVYKLDGKTAVGKQLAEVAGTAKVVTLWGGEDAESPGFMLVIAGANVPVDVDADLKLDVHEADDEQLAEQMGGLDYIAFTIDGVKKLPCTTQVFWRTTGAFANGEVVNVYHFDRESGTFKKIHKNIQTGEGYACFNVIDGGEYVIAKRDDLDAKAAEGEAGEEGQAAGGAAGGASQAGSDDSRESAASAADGEAAGQDSSEADGDDGDDGGQGDNPLKKMPPWSAPIGVTAAFAAAGVATYSVKRKNAAVSAGGAGESEAGASSGADGGGSVD